MACALGALHARLSACTPARFHLPSVHFELDDGKSLSPGPPPPQVLYAKHMAKHRIGIQRGLMAQGVHMLLVREPSAVIQSFGEVLEPTLTETCYPALCEIYSELRSAG